MIFITIVDKGYTLHTYATCFMSKVRRYNFMVRGPVLVSVNKILM